jgi:hypothetical protein
MRFAYKVGTVLAILSALAFLARSPKAIARNPAAIYELGEKIVEESFLIFRKAGPKGYKGVTEHIAKLKLNPTEAAELIVRVAAKDGRISAFEAAELHKNLKDVPGFAKTAKWVLVGEKTSGPTIGSLQELRVANNLRQRGYTIVELRASFNDPVKRITDIDLIVEKGGRRFAIESKAYERSLNWDQIAADANTLNAYRNANPATIPYFFFKRQPSDLVVKKLNEMGIKQVVVDDLSALRYLEL